MAIPQSFIQELLARIDVVDVVGKYVQLKKGGANFMGLCPFHGEKSPSFTVSPSKQFFHCFGCGKNGNAIGFLMEHTGMTFVEAVKDLAQQVGMQVPDEQQSPEERARAAAQKARQDTLTDILEKAGESWRKHLKETPRAVAYLKGRGLSGQIAKRFGLGYAPDGWRNLASVFPKYDDPLLAESGLVIQGDDDKRYDRFRDRIMFPIRNVKGECIGFGGRVLGDGTPKYLNSPETPVFHKGRELYGLFEAREALHSAGYVLVTEGYMDVVALAQLGFPNAVATLGTACTPDHVQKLFKFTDAVVFSFDGDAAGRRAARKALEGALPYATDTRSIKFLFLPAEHDPDSYIRAHGREGFAEQIRQAEPLSRFLVEAASADCDLRTAEGRARLSSQARPLWALLPDGALKRQLLAELAQHIQLPTEELDKLWRQQLKRDIPPAPLAAPEPHAQEHAGMEVQHYTTPTQSYPSGKPRKPWGNKPFSKPATPWRPSGPRSLPASRADHAARLLLTNMSLWDGLASEDQAMLCALPDPHGSLFAWMETQFHEHGPLGVSALLELMQDQPFAETAQTWAQAASLPADASEAIVPQEAQQELRRLLNLMHIDRLKQLETEALEQAQIAQDPEALARWRSLHERRRELMAQTTSIAAS